MLDLLKSLFKSTPSVSPNGEVDKIDILKALRTGLLVGLASTVAYFISILGNLDLGSYAGMLPVISMALDFVYRFLKDNTTPSPVAIKMAAKKVVTEVKECPVVKVSPKKRNS